MAEAKPKTSAKIFWAFSAGFMVASLLAVLIYKVMMPSYERAVEVYYEKQCKAACRDCAVDFAAGR